MGSSGRLALSAILSHVSIASHWAVARPRSVLASTAPSDTKDVFSSANRVLGHIYLRKSQGLKHKVFLNNILNEWLSQGKNKLARKIGCGAPFP